MSSSDRFANFIDSLPVVAKRPFPHNHIRAIDSSQFAQLHAKHLLHLGSAGLDGVLFPYLHGVEHGSSHMRNYFTPNSAGKALGQREGIGDEGKMDTEESGQVGNKVRPPDYRGLIWVSCEDDNTDSPALYLDDGLDEEMLVDGDELNIRRPSDASSLSMESSYSLLRTSVSTPDLESASTTPTLVDVELQDIADDITMSDEMPTPPRPQPIFIPCSFKPSDILSPSGDTLLPPKVPEALSLRNFGIQVAAYARISDMVVYSPTARGVSRSMLDLAERLAVAHEALYAERVANATTPNPPLKYNIFVLSSHPSELPRHVLSQIPNFSRMETLEMQTLTQASEVLPGIFLGNSSNVPTWSSSQAEEYVFDHTNNPDGWDLVVECVDGNAASAPSPNHLKRAEEHLANLQSLWATGFMSMPPARPPPNAHSILHLPFPCSPSAQANIQHIAGFISFLQGLLHPHTNSRRARVLLYSHDGYTETSVLALAMVMAEKKCLLSEAYLELQVRKGRSFFVHQNDLPLLKKLEQRYSGSGHFGSLGRSSLGRSRERTEKDKSGWSWSGFGKNSHGENPTNSNSPPFSNSSSPFKFGRRSHTSAPSAPPLYDNATWFNHPKFDGSFPSRVLPYLYLGNLNHAVNSHMLHALGITHVVSVGECAILPPDDLHPPGSTSKPHGHGSLWLEEREGRIKVLDIANMSDDGMDSLLPQLGSICDWIEDARSGGGKVLVHCRVGVSRSATVTIAYLMKHLKLSLVDSYLVVRSRRLSVLIQPNMRLLFNLLGWEVQLARERQQTKAKVDCGDEKNSATELKQPMASTNGTIKSSSLVAPEDEAVATSLHRALNWPFLAREVHRLNAKYIR